MSFMKKVYKVHQMPRFYGKTYTRHDANYTVAHPIPINWIISISRDIWLFLMRGKSYRDQWELTIRSDEYARGYKSGYNEAKAHFYNYMRKRNLDGKKSNII